MANEVILAGETADDQELFDEGYEAGKKAAYGSMLNLAFRELGIDDPKGHAALLQAELMEARLKAKELWGIVIGEDAPYPGDNTYLADVLNRIADKASYDYDGE